jgi:hypothetical protein
VDNYVRNFFCCIAVAVGITAPGTPADAQEQRPVLGRPVPYEIIDPPWLDERGQRQLATLEQFETFVRFRFADRLAESGITFRNRVVDDAGVTYKAVHYDHGNGIAVADVDDDGLPDVYFVNQAGRNELWRNLGDGRFEDITDSAGVGVADRISVTASFADTDNDGDPDLYVTTVRDGNLLFENRDKGRFVDISDDSGLDHRGHSSGAVFFDYDRDGRVDLYLTNVGRYTSDEKRTGRQGEVDYTFYDGYADAFGGHHFPERTEPSLLFRNLGDNRFEDVTGIISDVEPGWSGDATAVDINRDGWPDIYELNMQGHDQYYENQAGRGFVRKSRDVFPKTSWGAMGIKAFDWNNDGRVDIYITDMHSDMSQDVGPDEERAKSDMQWNEDHLKSNGLSIFGNSFFEQQADGTFKEVSDRIGAENYWPWGLSVGDLNADGYEDVFVTLSMNYPFRYQTNTLLINDHGRRLRPAEFIVGIEPRRERRTAQPWFDLDCLDEHDRRHRMCAGTDRPVQVWGALGSRSSVIFDLDNDGDLDIVTNEFNGEPQVLISDLGESRDSLNYIKLRLVGTRSNAAGLGARVTVVAGDLSQSLLPLYFGLGDSADIDRVVIEWPSGEMQTVRNPDLNTLLVVTEPR